MNSCCKSCKLHFLRVLEIGAVTPIIEYADGRITINDLPHFTKMENPQTMSSCHIISIFLSSTQLQSDLEEKTITSYLGIL